MSNTAISPKAQTVSVASRSKPSANTDRRRSISLLGSVEQRIRPVDGGPQRLMSRQGGAAPAGEEAEALVEAVVKAVQGQGPQPGGGQLDGQRHPVQAAADRHDDRYRSASTVRSTPWARARSTNRATALMTRAPRSRIGKRQRRHAVDGLAGDAQRLSAGGHEVHPRAPPSLWRRRSWRRRRSGARSCPGRSGCPADPGHRAGPPGRPAGLRGDPSASAMAVGTASCRRPGPARPATPRRRTRRASRRPPAGPAGSCPTRRPGQRHQARGLRPERRPRHLPVAPDERGRAGRGGCSAAPGCRASATAGNRLQARGLELEDPFGASEVLQPVDAEILEYRAGR